MGHHLGHAKKLSQKLQRAIAETRTQYPDRALPLFQGKPAGGDSAYRSDDSNDVRPARKGEGNIATGTASTKRKYRRHPKVCFHGHPLKHAYSLTMTSLTSMPPNGRLQHMSSSRTVRTRPMSMPESRSPVSRNARGTEGTRAIIYGDCQGRR